MNICIITSSFPSNPHDVVQAPFLIDFIEGLIKREHQVFVFTQDREGEKKEFLKGVRVNWFPWLKSKRPLVQLNPLNPLDCLRIWNLLQSGKKALVPFVRENRIDACLGVWVLPSGYFANDVYQRTGIPYSVWALGSDIYRYGRIPLLYPVMKRIIHEAKGVFADGFDLSMRVEKRFERKCFFLATTRTISSSPLLAGGEREGLANKAFHFLFVGRVEKVKGIDLLLQSMALLIEEGLNVHLTIVGRGRLEQWGKNFVRKNGMGERVEWKGNVSDEELASLYVSSDCVVIPSRSESIPLVFSEALKFDRELIVADVGDMGRLGRQYGVAWVIPPEDPMALRAAMKKRAESQQNDETREGKGKKEELKRLFDIETSVERFLQDYL
jgi:glycosyltransferase involved in cell wall biosynthesis